MVECIFERLEGLHPPFGFELTLPDDDAVPPHPGQLLQLLMVALPVSLDFLFPEPCVGFGHSEGLAPFMPVPETAIDKDTRAVFSHHDIRVPRQPAVIESVPEPSGEEIFSHDELRLGVLRMDGRHIVVAPLLILWGHERS